MRTYLMRVYKNLANVDSFYLINLVNNVLTSQRFSVTLLPYILIWKLSNFVNF